jgi:hypothetical protein
MQLQCVPENEGEHTIQACGSGAPGPLVDTSFERKNLVRRRNWQIRRAHQALANQPSFRKATSVKILQTP